MLRVSLPRNVRERLETALQHAQRRECGGVMLGEHIGTNHFVIRNLTVQRPGAVASFVRRLRGAVSAIKRYCRAHGNDFQRFNYLGEWHSHPSFSVHPSNQDHATMRGLAMDQGVGANFVVLLIVRLNRNELEGSVHTYLPDGSVHPSELVMEDR